jgi:hypothetical protein
MGLVFGIRRVTEQASGQLERSRPVTVNQRLVRRILSKVVVYGA